jgi:A/G-specific adenine glycosylase
MIKRNDLAIVINEKERSEIQQTLLQWGKENYKKFPWRATANQFHALIAESMLQRTRAEQVLHIYEEFASLYPTPESVLREDKNKVKAMLMGLGLRWRAETILKLVERLHELQTIPETYDDLIALPGVGSYVASAYLSLHNNVRLPIVDSNVVRLWVRVFGLSEKKELRRDKAFNCIVDWLTPTGDFQAFNYAVLDFTRAICRPKPLHDKCPLKSICQYYKGLPLAKKEN